MERTCPLILVSNLSCPSAYLMISPLQEQMRSVSSTSMGLQRGELISRIFSELLSENIAFELYFPSKLYIPNINNTYCYNPSIYHGTLPLSPLNNILMNYNASNSQMPLFPPIHSSQKQKLNNKSIFSHRCAREEEMIFLARVKRAQQVILHGKKHANLFGNNDMIQFRMKTENSQQKLTKPSSIANASYQLGSASELIRPHKKRRYVDQQRLRSCQRSFMPPPDNSPKSQTKAKQKIGSGAAKNRQEVSVEINDKQRESFKRKKVKLGKKKQRNAGAKTEPRDQKIEQLLREIDMVGKAKQLQIAYQNQGEDCNQPECDKKIFAKKRNLSPKKRKPLLYSPQVLSKPLLSAVKSLENIHNPETETPIVKVKDSFAIWAIQKNQMEKRERQMAEARVQEKQVNVGNFKVEGWVMEMTQEGFF